MTKKVFGDLERVITAQWYTNKTSNRQKNAHGNTTLDQLHFQRMEKVFTLFKQGKLQQEKPKAEIVGCRSILSS